MNIAGSIDHTLLKPEATETQIRTLCAEAQQFQFASACVNPCWAPLVAQILRGSGIKTCCVVGFPLGASQTSVKAYEAGEAVNGGAEELDMVINIGWVKGKDFRKAASDITAVRAVAPRPLILKVIIESAALTDDEIQAASQICVDQGVDFVKTSTGMHPAGGAKLENVELIMKTIKGQANIKASGGIRTYADVVKYLDAGATRIGCSSGVQIIREASC
jgi:deoxyribose-phosphate aldolase